MTKNINVLYKLSSLHGTIIHYYHFFYSVLVPLIIEYVKLSINYDRITIFIDDSIGPMWRILFELPIDIKLMKYTDDLDKYDIQEKYLTMMDVHPSKCERDEKFIKKNWAKRFEYKHYQLLNMFMKRKMIDHRILTCDTTFNIVMVERFVNITYASIIPRKNLFPITTNGSQRRSIPNYDEVVQVIKDIYPDKSLIKISTEYMSLFYQYHLLSTCDLLIAQHGAVLAQISFMKPGATIIEIVDEDKIITGENWFKPVSEACKIKHHQYVTKDSHEVINTEKFRDFVRSVQ